MPTATLTSKGQITVPKAVRDALHLRPGDRLAFQVKEDGSVEMRPETISIRSLVGIVKTKRKASVSIEEMNEAIRRGGTRR